MKNELDIFQAIKSTGIEVLKDYGDKGLTELAKIFDKELLEGIPYVSPIVNIATFGSTIKKYSFAKKIIRFLTQLESVPLVERENFIQKLENTNERKKVGEKLILLIDSLDDDDKADILGKVFKKTIEGKITINNFQKIALGIKNIYLDDLLLFIEWYPDSNYNLPEDINSSLYQNGFLSLKINETNKVNEDLAAYSLGEKNIIVPTLDFCISELGLIFLTNYN